MSGTDVAYAATRFFKDIKRRDTANYMLATAACASALPVLKNRSRVAPYARWYCYLLRSTPYARWYYRSAYAGTTAARTPVLRQRVCYYRRPALATAMGPRPSHWPVACHGRVGALPPYPPDTPSLRYLLRARYPRPSLPPIPYLLTPPIPYPLTPPIPYKTAPPILYLPTRPRAAAVLTRAVRGYSLRRTRT
eukprot:1491597-Rhodomonas_salina.2